MRVVVTGSSGFLGSWICRVLAQHHAVTALVRPNSETYRLEGIDSLNVQRSEVSDWTAFVTAEKPDVLILADWWGVGNRDRNDLRQFDNIERMENLALAAKDCGVGLVIGVGSQAELGPVSNRITEDLPDNPTTEYGKAKVAARKAAQKVLEGSATRFAWLRIFSTYGPSDTDSWLIPQLIDTLTIGAVMELTKGEQEWSYLHAYDLARAFAAVIEDGTISGIVNVGNPQTIILKDAIHIIADQLGANNLLGFGKLDYRPDQVMKLEPACESLTAIGWKPVVSFAHGIAQTIQWRHRDVVEPLHCDDGQKVVFNLPPRR
ncbi:unannotated protein [freshwater metagenome]|uniref:Unannotated protein n=1 Tax=freshwater metagenome TaxID=449393 RepID=A0A6J7VWP9_9ZZZZ